MNARTISLVGIVIFARTFACPIAYAQVGKHPTVSSILAEAEREAQKLDKNERGIWTRGRAYISMAETCATIGRTEEGKRLLGLVIQDIRDLQQDPDVKADFKAYSVSEDLLAIAQTARALGDDDGAQAYLNEALKVAQDLRGYNRVSRQCDAATIYLDMGMKDRARKLAKAAEESFLQDSGEEDNAFRGMVLSDIATLYHKLEDEPRTQAKIASMRKISMELPSDGFEAYERWGVDMAILSTLIAIEEYDAALEIARKLEQSRMVIEIASAYFKKGEMQKAEALLKEAIDMNADQIERSFRGKEDLAHTHAMVATVYARHGEHSKAQEHLAAARKLAIEFPKGSPDLGSAYNWAAWRLQAYRGDYDAAIDTARLLEDRQARCNALAAIADIMARRQ